MVLGGNSSGIGRKKALGLGGRALGLGDAPQLGEGSCGVRMRKL